MNKNLGIILKFKIIYPKDKADNRDHISSQYLEEFQNKLLYS